jgi:type II secretory pathway pseudopilin PulG
MRSAQGGGDGGYAMAALLVTLAVMSVILGMALPVWRTVVQREKEEELIFRGRQYARAIQLYQRKYAAAYPASIDVLVEQKFLRKKYKDPMTKGGEFEVIYQGTLAQRQAALAGRGAAAPGAQGTSSGLQAGAGRGGMTGQTVTAPGSPFGSQTTGPQGGMVGVASKSKEKSIRILDGKTAYNEWQFIWVPAQATRTGPAGSTGRGGQPGRGQPGPQRGRGPGGASSPFSQPPGR